MQDFFYNSLLVFKITCSLILHVFHNPVFQLVQPCPCFILQEPPVKRSRSLSPKSSFRESEELRKLKIAEKKTENLEKTLQLKVNTKITLNALATSFCRCRYIKIYIHFKSIECTHCYIDCNCVSIKWCSSLILVLNFLTS